MNTIAIPLKGNDSARALLLARKEIAFANRQRTIALLKRGVWIYFYLLIFEGALRKWVFPSLSNPLLIIRDPVAIWMLFTAWRTGIVKTNIYQIGIIFIGLIGFFTAVTLGHGNIAVAAYGTRIFLIHFPLMFVIGRAFDREDVIKLGKVMLWLSLPMVVLIATQFYSPQSAWVNLGVGGDTDGAGFSGALGFFRPPGTFSFTSGNSLFFGFLAFYVLYFWTTPQNINKIVLYSSSIALIASIPLSISRTLFFTIGVAIVFALIGAFRKPKYFNRIIVALIISVLALSVLNQTAFFQTSTLAFTERFTSANESEGGLEGVIGDRYLGGMIGAIANSEQIPFFGFGIGMGTNVGAQILTGSVSFLISEGEWGRLIGEMGLLLGLLTILIRLAFCATLTSKAYNKLKKSDILPWMLLGFALLNIPQSQWAQPTALGFSTLIGGLVIASFNKPDNLRKNKTE